jgi:outer membrane protein TolC
MGIPADTPTVVQDNLVYQPLTIDRTQLIGRALAQRPEYKQVKLRVSEAEARAAAGLPRLLPDITGTGFYGATRFDMNEIWEVGRAALVDALRRRQPDRPVPREQGQRRGRASHG